MMLVSLKTNKILRCATLASQTNNHPDVFVFGNPPPSEGLGEVATIIDFTNAAILVVTSTFANFVVLILYHDQQNAARHTLFRA